MTNFYHTPVLLETSVELMDIQPDGTYVDLTFGGGGHSRHILSKLGPKGRLYSFDQDKDTLANAPMTTASTTWRAIFVSCVERCVGVA